MALACWIVGMPGFVECRLSCRSEVVELVRLSNGQSVSVVAQVIRDGGYAELSR